MSTKKRDRKTDIPLMPVPLPKADQQDLLALAKELGTNRSALVRDLIAPLLAEYRSRQTQVA